MPGSSTGPSPQVSVDAHSDSGALPRLRRSDPEGGAAAILEGELVNPRAVLARLRDAFAVPVSIDGRQIAVSASLGVRISRAGEPGGADTLLRDADVAMYETKRRGKGGYTVFEGSMHARALDQFELQRSVLTTRTGRAFK